MNQKQGFRVIKLTDLWSIFVNKLIFIVLIAVVVTIGSFLINKITFTPQYSSTATLYILRQSQDSNATDTSSDFSLALKVVNDCTYLLKSHTVLDQVILDLSLDTDYEELYKCISTANPDETRILEVTVTAESPERAKKIVDAICTVGSTQIETAMGFQQVNLFEYGTLNDSPCNQVSSLYFIIYGIAAAVILYVIFLIAFLLDDRIQTNEDIERLLGLSVLGEIPCADSKKRSKYGYYNAYKTKDDAYADSNGAQQKKTSRGTGR